MGCISGCQTTSGKRYRAMFRKPDHAQTQKRGFTTKREAELFLASVEVDKSRGAYIDPSKSRVLVGEWLDDWTESRADWRPTSRERARGIVALHIKPSLAGYPLGKGMYWGGQNNYGLLVEVLAYCGLRWGEASGLRVQDVDFARGRLEVQHTIVEVDGVQLDSQPKENEARSIPVPAWILAELKSHVKGEEGGSGFRGSPRWLAAGSCVPARLARRRREHDGPGWADASRVAAHSGASRDQGRSTRQGRTTDA